VPEVVTLKDLARTADAIVEARVSDPARAMRQELTDDGCGGFAVQVYRLDVLTVRLAPQGTTVPAQIDAYDPNGWIDGMYRHAECVKGLHDGKLKSSYATPISWGPGKELVVLLEWDGTRWLLASEGSFDDVNRADKVARWAGVRQ
jgi:hypothetical protein